MVLDMRPMLRGELDRIRIDFTFTPDPIDGAEFDGDAHATGCVTDQAGYMHLELTATVAYRAECARCLESVKDSFSVTLERTVASETSLSEKQLEENVDEYAVIQDGHLDLGDLIREELFLSFPMRILCSDDCPGLCPRCGKPLRLGDCGCPKREIDPRWAVLGSLLDENADPTDS